MKTFDFTKKNNATNQIEKVGSLKFDSFSESRAKLYLYGDIVSNTWQSYWYEEDCCPQDIVEFLSGLETYSDIDIYINSGGGAVHGGLAIYNILKRNEGYITTYVDGLAASIASVIALVGDTVVVPTNAQLMIHKPWSYAIGNADDMRREAEALDSCQKAIMNVYMEHVQEGISEDTIEDLVNKETWITGEEAAKYFKVQTRKQNEIFNCVSDYFAAYKNTPTYLKNAKKHEIELLQLKLKLLDT